MAVLNPVLVVKDYTAGVDAPVGHLVPLSSVGSILQAQLAAPPDPATPAPQTPTTTTVPGVVSLSIHRRLGVPEDLAFVANGGTVSALTPGLQPGGTRIIGMSLDNAAKMDARMLSGGTQVTYDFPVSVTESGKGIGSVLATTVIPRMTAQQITLGALFNGAPNTIESAAGQIIAPNNILPDLAGIAFVPVGLPRTKQAAALAHTFPVDAAIADILLDVDINEDTVLRAIQTIVERIGAYADPQQAQFVVDSSDFGVYGGSQSVAIGHKGAAPVLTFKQGAGVTQPILRGTLAQAQTIDMSASCAFKGGDTHHGVPDGGKFTAIRTINQELLDATGNYRSGLPVIAHYINRYQGGVYFWPGDGTLHPMSQAMGVTDLWYDENGPVLEAATEAGVYEGPADPDAAAKAPWKRLGSMALKVLRVQREQGVVYALVEAQATSTRSVIQYPASSPGADLAKSGMAGWSLVCAQAGISDFVVMGGYCYYVAQGTEDRVWQHHIGTSDNDLPMKISVDQNSGSSPTVTGMDVMTAGNQGTLATGMFVRTTSGAGALYYVAAGTTALLTAGMGLVDDSRLPLMVNSISQHGAGVVQWSTGARSVTLWAATNQGCFMTASPTGNNWTPTIGQSNLGDLNLLHIVSAPPRTWLGRILTRVYALTDNALYVSHNGTVNWVDVFSNALDTGAAFYALWKKQYGVWPDNLATGTYWSGKPLYYPVTSKAYNLVRSLDGLGEYRYTLYNWQSQAPAGAHRSALLSYISTPALVPEVNASQLLLDAMVRFLAYTARPQTILTIDSYFEDTADPLRALQPTQMVLVSGTFEQCVDGGDIVYVTYTDQPFYVLEHTITFDAATDPTGCTTTTRVGAILLDDRSDPNKIAADALYELNRQQKYRVRGRH